MCKLSISQVVVSAYDASGYSPQITVSQVFQYNDLLIKGIPDYNSAFDLDDLFYEVKSVSPDFEVFLNGDYRRSIRFTNGIRSDDYFKSIPEDIIELIKTEVYPIAKEIIFKS